PSAATPGRLAGGSAGPLAGRTALAAQFGLPAPGPVAPIAARWPGATRSARSAAAPGPGLRRTGTGPGLAAGASRFPAGPGSGLLLPRQRPPAARFAAPVAHSGTVAGAAPAGQRPAAGPAAGRTPPRPPA